MTRSAAVMWHMPCVHNTQPPTKRAVMASADVKSRSRFVTSGKFLNVASALDVRRQFPASTYSDWRAILQQTDTMPQ
jgi:hypothetical protein